MVFDPRHALIKPLFDYNFISPIIKQCTINTRNSFRCIALKIPALRSVDRQNVKVKWVNATRNHSGQINNLANYTSNRGIGFRSDIE